MENVDVIFLRGAPGSGKSQVAKSLTKFFPKGVRLEVDALRHMIVSVDWKNQKEHFDILNLSTRLVYDFLKLGYKPVIVVDTFSGNKIKKYIDDLFQIDESVTFKIFGLYTTEIELKRRLEERSNDDFRDFEISRRVNKEVLRIKFISEYQVDTTGLLPSQAAHIIQEQLYLSNDK
jgi:predicted kinase